MKRKTLLILTLLMTTAVMEARPITLGKALALAAEYAAPGHEVTLCKAAGMRRASSKSAPYYVFSRGEGQGYVIVAGDDCIPSIIGYTESGDFDEQREAPQLLAMLDHYAHVVETMQAEGTNVPYDEPAHAKSEGAGMARARANIPVLMTSHWHQSSPYNDRVPVLANGNRALAGCVAVAGAQVFYYWRKDMPSTLGATTPTYDFGEAPVTQKYRIEQGTPLKWELMCDSYGSQPSEFHDAVATFVAALGMQTYLEYGPSTGGHVWNLPYSLYNLQAKRANKDDGFTDESWAALIYADLLKGHPVIYSGYKEDWEGHALVIDGYKAGGDLFHFNFGWGGQSDGYYTVRESGNSNVEFSMSPTVMYDIHPVRHRLETDIRLPGGFYANSPNDVEVSISNKSSETVSGFYLFVNTSNTLPQEIKNAVAMDATTEIGVDKTASLRFKVTPTSSHKHYLTVTDGALNVLATKVLEPATAVPELWVESFSVNGSSKSEHHGRNDYTVVYNKRAVAVARISNKGASGYVRNMRVLVARSDDDGKNWQQLGQKAGQINVDAHGTAEVSFTVSNSTTMPLVEGVLYRVTMVSPVPLTEDIIHYGEQADTAAYFMVRTPDLAVEHFEDGVLALSGHWDPTLFSSVEIARNELYLSATSYDLTRVRDLDEVPTLAGNPNALFYVSGDAGARGDNVVRDGYCERLILTPGYDFVPWKPFLASTAAVRWGKDVGRWHLLTVPFAVDVPDGVMARRIDGHGPTGISGMAALVNTLLAGQTYLLMASHTDNMTLTASDVEVAVSPGTNADPALVGSFVNLPTPDNAMTLVASKDAQQFVSDGESSVEALRGYFMASDIEVTAFSAHADETMDRAYVSLAGNISEAYDILYKYRPYVSEEAFDDYLTEIAGAEHLFSRHDDAQLNTAAKLSNYGAQLLADGSEYMRQITRPGAVEVDFSSRILNPSFELKTPHGWTLTQPLNTAVTASFAAKVFANSSYNYLTAGADGSYLMVNAYQYQNSQGDKDTLGVGISQKVTGLVPGYYRMTVALASDEGKEITAFAGDSTATVKAHPFGKHYFTRAIVDSVRVEAVDSEASLMIGVLPGSWYKADDFHVFYLGSLDEVAPDNIAEVGQVSPKRVKGIFTLLGVRLGRISRPGIYIIDGRKTIVR